MTEDLRSTQYRDLHSRQLVADIEKTRTSARRILGILFEFVRPNSVLDVGCGLGTWLATAAELGVQEIHGIEGHWLDKRKILVDRARVTLTDLESGFSLGRRFDLAICLEVAEHLQPAAAEPLVASLTTHSPLVLFSAAIPHQGGHHHVNEQFPDYWAALFQRHGYRLVDLFRGRIWDDPQVLWWLQQNALLFVHESVLAASEPLRREAEIPRPMNIVLPNLYLYRIEQREDLVKQYRHLIGLLSQGGTFTASLSPEKNVVLQRKPE